MSSILALREAAILPGSRSCSAGILAGIFLFTRASALPQTKSRAAAEILGTWEGESKCTVPSSPCRDEHVVYEIVEEKTATASLKMDGYKIVNGERQFMGTLRCEYNAPKKNLSCTLRGKDYDDWEYILSGDTLQGTLTTGSGKALYRKITVKKKPIG